MRNLDEMTITQAVLAYNRGASDARLYEVMTSLVQHLHAFARDIKLSEGEWRQGMAFLGDVGQVAPAGEEFAAEKSLREALGELHIQIVNVSGGHRSWNSAARMCAMC